MRYLILWICPILFYLIYKQICFSWFIVCYLLLFPIKVHIDIFFYIIGLSLNVVLLYLLIANMLTVSLSCVILLKILLSKSGNSFFKFIATFLLFRSSYLDAVFMWCLASQGDAHELLLFQMACAWCPVVTFVGLRLWLNGALVRLMHFARH